MVEARAALDSPQLLRRFRSGSAPRRQLEPLEPLETSPRRGRCHVGRSLEIKLSSYDGGDDDDDGGDDDDDDEDDDDDDDDDGENNDDDNDFRDLLDFGHLGHSIFRSISG